MLKTAEQDPSLDAVIAAPDFHRVLLENDEIRVLEVVVPAGSKEPFHTHKWSSVFIVFGTPHLRYYTPGAEKHLFEIEAQQETGVLHLAPEGLHSLENVDQRDLYAFRVEMKNAPGSDKVSVRGPVLEVGIAGDDLRLDNDVVNVCRRPAGAAPIHRPTLRLRRSEPASIAAWIDDANGLESGDSDDILLTLKYCPQAVLE